MSKDRENMLGAVAYLAGALSGVLLLLLEKDNKFVRFHALQSIVVSLAVMGLGLVAGMVPVIGWLVLLVLPLATFAGWLFLMWKAFNGQMYKVPYVGEWVEKKLGKMGS